MGYLESKSKVVSRTDYRIDLFDFYSKSGVKISERIIVDPKTMVPWFACFSYFGLEEEKRARVLEAVEEMHKKTDGVIFRSSSDSDPKIRVNALLRHPATPDENFMGDVKKYFQELENIIKGD